MTEPIKNLRGNSASQNVEPRSGARLNLDPPDTGLFDDEDLVGKLPDTAETLRIRKSLPSTKLNLLSSTKVLVFVGRGNTGKTTTSKFVVEEAASQGRDFFAAACDFGERTLANLVDGVLVPKSNDLATSVNFFRTILESAARQKMSGLVDLGAGGEAILLRLNDRVDFIPYCKELGIVPVFIHTIATSVNDLAVLATFQQLGLWPDASAIIFNEMLVPAGSDREETFDLIARQSCVRNAIAMGAPQLWLPALDRSTFKEIDRRRLQFGQAARREANPGNSLGPLGPHDAYVVGRWLERTRHELSPISSWLL